MSAIVTNQWGTLDYSDIMSDTGVGVGVNEIKGTNNKVVESSTTNYFAQKRNNTKDQVIGIQEMDCMVFVPVTQRNRGIRPSELARSQAWEHRQKIQRNQEAQKQGTPRQQQEARAYALQKQQEKESQKQQKEREMQQFQQKRRELEATVPSCEFKSETVEDNTAW